MNANSHTNFYARSSRSIRRAVRLAALLLVCVSASVAFAQSTISGSVKGLDGRAAAGAQVRVQRERTKTPPIVLRADANGRFMVPNLAAGDYSVAVVENGNILHKAVRLAAGKPINMTLDLRRAPRGVATAASAKPKRYVWVPAPTGSRIGGGYEEVNDDSVVSTSVKDPGEVMQRLQQAPTSNVGPKIVVP